MDGPDLGLSPNPALWPHDIGAEIQQPLRKELYCDRALLGAWFQKRIFYNEHFHLQYLISYRKKQLILRHACLCIKWSTLECWRQSLAVLVQEKNLLFFMRMEGGKWTNNFLLRTDGFHIIKLTLHSKKSRYCRKFRHYFLFILYLKEFKYVLVKPLPLVFLTKTVYLYIHTHNTQTYWTVLLSSKNEENRK